MFMQGMRCSSKGRTRFHRRAATGICADPEIPLSHTTVIEVEQSDSFDLERCLADIFARLLNRKSLTH